MRHERIAETHPAGREPVERRRLEKRVVRFVAQLPLHHPERVVAVIVGNDEQHVGLARFFRRQDRNRSEKREDECEEKVTRVHDFGIEAGPAITDLIQSMYRLTRPKKNPFSPGITP